VIRFKPNLQELGVLKGRLQGLPAAVQPIAMVGAARSANQLARMVREAILTQSVRMKALTPDWKAEKKRRGLDPRKLVATQEYVNSIQVFPVRGGYAVGTDWEFVLVHEYGAPAANIPARPHWRPTVNKWQKTSGKTIKMEFYNGIADYFAKGKAATNKLEQEAKRRSSAQKKTGTAKLKSAIYKVLGISPKKRRSASTGGAGRTAKPASFNKAIEDLIRSAMGKRGGTRTK